MKPVVVWPLVYKNLYDIVIDQRECEIKIYFPRKIKIHCLAGTKWQPLTKNGPCLLVTVRCQWATDYLWLNY